MMIEDKLDTDQRLRLECLAQAVAATVIERRPTTAELIVTTADTFEQYVRNGVEIDRGDEA